MHTEHDWFTVEELRGWLCLGRTKAHELVAGGEIPSYKIGRLRRIRKADVERYLAARVHDPRGVAAGHTIGAEGQEHPGGSDA